VVGPINPAIDQTDLFFVARAVGASLEKIVKKISDKKYSGWQFLNALHENPKIIVNISILYVFLYKK